MMEFAAKEVAFVPPELTSRVPVKFGSVSTVRAPEEMERSAPVRSLKLSALTIKLVVEAVIKDE